MNWRGVEISETWVQRFVKLRWKIFEISETRGIPCYLLATLNFLRQPGVIREQNLGNPWPKTLRGKICFTVSFLPSVSRGQRRCAGKGKNSQDTLVRQKLL